MGPSGLNRISVILLSSGQDPVDDLEGHEPAGGVRLGVCHRQRTPGLRGHGRGEEPLHLCLLARVQGVPGRTAAHQKG